MCSQTLPRLIEHRLRIILQGHAGARKGAQHLLGHHAIAAADIQYRNLALYGIGRGGEHLPQAQAAFFVARHVPGDPFIDVARRVPIVMVD